MKKFILSLLFIGMGYQCHALTMTDIGNDFLTNSKATFLKQAQLGWGWDLKINDAGAPTAILGVYSYRFVSLNIGWHDPYNAAQSYYPSPMLGIAIDQLGRAINPQLADQVLDYVPPILQPVWKQLTISYGPLYRVSTGEWSHMLAVNFIFGS